MNFYSVKPESSKFLCYTLVTILANETIFGKYQEVASQDVILKNVKHRERANTLFMFIKITTIRSVNDNNALDDIY